MPDCRCGKKETRVKSHESERSIEAEVRKRMKKFKSCNQHQVLSSRRKASYAAGLKLQGRQILTPDDARRVIRRKKSACAEIQKYAKSSWKHYETVKAKLIGVSLLHLGWEGYGMNGSSPLATPLWFINDTLGRRIFKFF